MGTGYRVLDAAFTVLHLVIIGFNLTGWIWESTRRAHLISIGVTAASWFILGIWYGMGYCPITDWQWRIKEKLGEKNLPNSFIQYFADQLTGLHLDPSVVDALTATFFALAAILSIFLNLGRKKAIPIP